MPGLSLPKPLRSHISPAEAERGDQREFWPCGADAGDGFLGNSDLWRNRAFTQRGRN